MQAEEGVRACFCASLVDKTLLVSQTLSRVWDLLQISYAVIDEAARLSPKSDDSPRLQQSLGSKTKWEIRGMEEIGKELHQKARKPMWKGDWEVSTSDTLSSRSDTLSTGLKLFILLEVRCGTMWKCACHSAKMTTFSSRSRPDGMRVAIRRLSGEGSEIRILKSQIIHPISTRFLDLPAATDYPLSYINSGPFSLISPLSGFPNWREIRRNEETRTSHDQSAWSERVRDHGKWRECITVAGKIIHV